MAKGKRSKKGNRDNKDNRNRKTNKPKTPEKTFGSLYLERKSIKQVADERHLVFSFKHLSKKQGLTIEEWGNIGMWSKTMETIRNHSTMSREDAKEGKGALAIYGDFPLPDNTKFTEPSYTPEDAIWCRIHVQGDKILAGHIYENIFFLVFLDDKHEFYLTKRQRGN